MGIVERKGEWKKKCSLGTLKRRVGRRKKVWMELISVNEEFHERENAA